MGAQYEFNRSLMAYATVARGYKGPQIALGDQTVPGTIPRVIRPEIPMSYELGVKATAFHGRLSSDLSLFYTKVHDFQGQLCTPAAFGLTCNPQNIGTVVSKGVELNAFARPVRGVSLNAGVIYNPVKYPNGFLGQDGSDLTGAQLIAVPKWKFTAAGEYALQVTSSKQLFFGVDSVYKSSLLLAASTDPNVILPGHWILGGQAGVRGASDRWSISLFARNVTNNHEPAIRYQNFPDPGSYGDISTFTAFRQIGISADIRF